LLALHFARAWEPSPDAADVLPAQTFEHFVIAQDASCDECTGGTRARGKNIFCVSRVNKRQGKGA
jgi:hypothetical protein